MTELRSGADPAHESELHALQFGVERSIRYHSKRRQHYDLLGAASTFLGLLSGSAAVASATTQIGWLVVWLGALAALVSAANLVIGSTGKARTHHDLQRKFTELQKLMLEAPAPTIAELAKWTARRAEIEADEPPKLLVLDMMCHNELTIAWGYVDQPLASINCVQRALADWTDIGAEGSARSFVKAIQESRRSALSAAPEPS